MKAIGLSTYGPPEVLHPIVLPDPHPGPGEVRIRVRAAGVNPVDAMLREGLLAEMNRGLEPPFVPGLEVAGAVDEIGAGVCSEFELAVGTDVVGFVNSRGHHGGYSENIVVPAASVTRMPANANFAEAASFLNNALTARNALDALALEKGSTLLVSGAAGSVGGYLVQLAVLDGLRVVAVAGPSDEEMVRSFGAAVVLPRGDDIAMRVSEAVPGGVDAVADAALLHEQIVPAIRDGGSIGVFRKWNGKPGRGITVHALNVRERSTDHLAIVRLREQVESGLLTVRVAETFPAEQAIAAHRRMELSGLRGRIILEFPAGH